jgi:hypothetical protein
LASGHWSAWSSTSTRKDGNRRSGERAAVIPPPPTHDPARHPNNGRFGPRAAMAPSGSLTREAAVPAARFELRARFAERCRFPTSSFVVPMRRQKGPAQTRR